MSTENLISKIRGFLYYRNSMATKSKLKRERRRSLEVIENDHTQLHQFYGAGDIKDFKPRNEKQHAFWSAMYNNTVTIAHGCAGTGKTLLALWFGMLEVSDKVYDKVVYVRSDVGTEYQRGRGALPGTLEEKMLPLIGPLLDNLPVFMKTSGAADYVLRTKKVEPMLLEDIRGRSLNDCFIVVDECQNFTIEQMKTVLTRVGANSKIVLVGDTKQADLDVFRRSNGLSDAVHRLDGLKDVEIIQFTKDEIVRNSVIAHIIGAYD